MFPFIFLSFITEIWTNFIVFLINIVVQTSLSLEIVTDSNLS